MSINTLTCPTDCSAKVPVVSFSPCAPSLKEGQITKIYVGNDGYPLVNWTDPAEWATRISNSSTSNTAIRELTVLGDKPLAAKTENKISGGRTVFSAKDFTVNVRMDDNNDDNYEFARATECNGQFRVWYESGGKLYGGNEGVLALVQFEEVIPEDTNAYATLNGVLRWTDKFSPIRITSPFA